MKRDTDKRKRFTIPNPLGRKGPQTIVLRETDDEIETRTVLSAEEIARMVGGTSPDMDKVDQREPLRLKVGGEPIRGNLIAELREAAGLSIEQLASAAGLPPRLVQTYEDGRDAPDDAGHRVVIAAALEQSDDDVFPEPKVSTPRRDRHRRGTAELRPNERNVRGVS